MLLLLALALMLAIVCALLTFKESYEHLVVGQSGTIPESRGVFATRPFARGEIVERCPVVQQRDEDLAGNLGDYVFNLGEGTVGVALGYGSLYNHSRNPHLDYAYDPDRNEMVFTARRPIRSGEEIFASYGDGWWTSRGMKPK